MTNMWSCQRQFLPNRLLSQRSALKKNPKTRISVGHEVPFRSLLGGSGRMEKQVSATLTLIRPKSDKLLVTR